MKNYCLIIFPLLLISACSSGDSKTQPATGDFKPFEIQLLGGQTLHSDSLAGKVVLVDYWATWCTPCIREVPGYNKLYQKYKEEDFVFLPICMDSGDAVKIAPFIEQFGIDYPVYVGNSKVRTAFGDLPGYPTTFVLDQKGKIRDKYVGISPTKIEEIDQIIGNLLNEKATP